MKLEIDNIELYYSDKKILSGVYFENEIGKVTGVLGRNGCGKSSLLKIIFGSLKPKYKLLRLDKKPILKPFYKTGLVTYLPQHSLLPKNLKLKDALFMMSVSWNDFVEVFPSFESYKEMNPKEISGGELRVIETYIVIKSSAKFILLDEPFSHIAPLFIEKIIKLIKEESPRKGIIITDHLHEHVIELCDELYLLKNGHTKLITSRNGLVSEHYLVS
ncbi:ATP-binding cassette domain-containing protein [Galbibacter mesophilus]|uniref:ATP-binding cassette domain-containing protein n=1 Tax=Galbibacter mesophilus TaxID=379069 RepID=UPI00191F491B|nr:ATP-binding cassette domain-containing protein [Galbibacter mesophilus]MCM5664438.1 ATP-binding cassette domain-containing protein [Galbibacter mesophilus]